ncbi:YcaO-like family protein [Paenibacillus chartarius]|uniref:YcaO-like family protein n=1 Tax=Paenibacillus chartarius TaxID=747481 RepID=A0ABV6DTA2_9BACL
MQGSLIQYGGAPSLQPPYNFCVGSRVGIVGRLVSLPPDEGGLAACVSFAVSADTCTWQTEHNGRCSRIVRSVGLTMEQAEEAAVSEAVARYCSAYVQLERTVLASRRDLGEGALCPDRIPRFLKEPFAPADDSLPDEPITESTLLRWVPGISFTSHAPVWVPASAVWPSYIPTERKEAAVRSGSAATGLACDTTVEHAVLRGLLDVLKNESYTIMQFHRWSPPKLELHTCPDLMGQFRLFQEKERFALHVMRMTTNAGIPASFSVLITRRGQVITGAGAGLTEEQSVTEALLQLAGNYKSCKPALLGMEPEHIYSLEAASCLTAVHTEHGLPILTKEEAEFAIASEKRLPVTVDERLLVGQTADRVHRIVQSLKHHKVDVVVVDVTTEDVRKLGLCAVKVIALGAAGLVSAGNEWTPNDRLSSMPVKRG